MSAPDGFVLDLGNWPVAVVHSPKRPVSDEEIECFIEEQRAMVARGERYVEIVNTTSVHMLPPSQRRRMAEFLREIDVPATELCAGLAVVIGSPVLRGGMTALLWIFRPSYPIKVVARMADAVQFLGTAADDAGIRLSPEAQDFLTGSRSRRTV